MRPDLAFILTIGKLIFTIIPSRLGRDGSISPPSGIGKIHVASATPKRHKKKYDRELRH